MIIEELNTTINAVRSNVCTVSKKGGIIKQ